ncbi:hypothetical protein SDC9_127243 [bioreactor metagenome]|uniref:Uncharacterized protein n=1 Tax=bioreactor metagenome TaxID=1076179 RepID=A0A645CSU7_9ZZZZ
MWCFLCCWAPILWCGSAKASSPMGGTGHWCPPHLAGWPLALAAPANGPGCTRGPGLHLFTLPRCCCGTKRWLRSRVPAWKSMRPTGKTFRLHCWRGLAFMWWCRWSCICFRTCRWYCHPTTGLRLPAFCPPSKACTATTASSPLPTRLNLNGTPGRCCCAPCGITWAAACRMASLPALRCWATRSCFGAAPRRLCCSCCARCAAKQSLPFGLCWRCGPRNICHGC